VERETQYRDPLGAFYLVTLDADWAVRPENAKPDGLLHARPVYLMPDAYPANASAGRIGVYNVAYRNFDQQITTRESRYPRRDLH
jgi:hypothetical protein